MKSWSGLRYFKEMKNVALGLSIMLVCNVLFILTKSKVAFVFIANVQMMVYV